MAGDSRGREIQGGSWGRADDWIEWSICLAHFGDADHLFRRAWDLGKQGIGGRVAQLQAEGFAAFQDLVAMNGHQEAGTCLLSWNHQLAGGCDEIGMLPFRAGAVST